MLEVKSDALDFCYWNDRCKKYVNAVKKKNLTAITVKFSGESYVYNLIDDTRIQPNCQNPKIL